MSTLALCIPAYQAESYLPRLLDSAKIQQIPFSEIWVYDDASLDNTAEIAKCYGANVLKGDVNRGCSFGKNALLEQVKSDWVHFHDADDLLLPNFSCLAQRWIRKNDCSDVVVLSYEYRDFLTDDLIMQSSYNPVELRRDPLRYAILNKIPNFAIYRVSKLKEVGGFDLDASILHNEDVAFHCKLALSGLSFDVEEEISVINYRMSRSMSVSSQVSCLLAQAEVMMRLSAQVGILYPLEIKQKLWEAATGLAVYGQWPEMKQALLAGNLLTPDIPANQSPLFANLVNIIGDSPAFWVREQAIRFLKPKLRSKTFIG